MKRTILLCAVALMSLSAMALSRSKVRTYARFLSDRMAYELDLTPYQYDDCYEINYDFIYSASRIMDDAVFGYYDAINRYYTLLDYRNEDLRYVLTARQYARFMAAEYFFSPIYSTGSAWAMRIYTTYSNRTFYYFDAPSIFKTYRGGHSRNYYTNSFYVNRYNNNDRFTGSFRLSGSPQLDKYRKHDFGTNLKQRTGPTYNNYKNPSADNRTQDTRYRDSSGNRNSPQINNRPAQSAQPAQPAQRSGSTTTGTRGGRSGRSTTTAPSTRQTTPATQPATSSTPQRSGSTAGSGRSGRSGRR